MAVHNVSKTIGAEREIKVETGKLAQLAGGAVTVQQGETVVLVAACSENPREGLNFFPLQVDYREKFSAAGKFPGGFFKREGRPSEKEILTSRMTDRPLRPLFPKGFRDDVQIMAGVLSADGENEADTLCMLGASIALMISDIPFNGPVSAVRVGRVDGEFIANPTHSEMEKSDIDLVYAGVPGKVIMIEGASDEISEQDLKDALEFADGVVKTLDDLQNELTEKAGKEKYEPVLYTVASEVKDAVAEYCSGKLEEALLISDKKKRMQRVNELYDEMVKELTPRFVAEDDEGAPNFRDALEEVEEETVRKLILKQEKRVDDRGLQDVRPLSIETGLLPRTHGSALFSRGETQALVTTTLGAEQDAQAYDVITGSGEGVKRFLLHYNFPNFSTGETGRIMGPGRREIGHGALAERSVRGLIAEDFPYTVRCVSDILGSNGSSSMASVCGASLALMDAGVPLKRSVAGLSVGLVTGDSEEEKVFLTDILGSEDHFGDMDFKVAGTREGITGFQLDLKLPGLSLGVLSEAMDVNYKGRMHILEEMEKCIAAPRSELSRHAPQIRTVKIKPDKIGALIGPGGSMIREITEQTGAEIDINDDGTVKIYAADADAMDAAEKRVNSVTEEVEIGKIYRGKVKSVKNFGAFVEILAGQEGLLHISEMADYHVDKVEDICNEGDWVSVKVIDIDDRGRVRLSRKQALEEL
ncbi:MAG: polyribonucleotide nucleotidyltransferase [Verrucomicrobiota bacterium]